MSLWRAKNHKFDLIFSFDISDCTIPFPQIDIIKAMVIVWRVRWKIIRSFLCNILQQLCTVQCTHI